MAPGLLLRAIAQFIHLSGIRTQAVGRDRLCASVPLQGLLDEGKRSSLVACLGDVAFKNLTLVVDRAPQVMLLPVDGGYAPLRVTNTSPRCQRK